MHKFDTLFLETVKKANLLRIRLKIDPKIRESDDFRSFDGYEGYILEESNSKLNVVLEFCGGATQVDAVPVEIIEIIEPEGDYQLSIFKVFVTEWLTSKKHMSDELAGKIAGAQSLDDIESILKGDSVTDAHIKNMYRDLIFNYS